MWQRRKRLKLLEEELNSINVFERLYENSTTLTEVDQVEHRRRRIRAIEVMAEIDRLQHWRNNAARNRDTARNP